MLRMCASTVLSVTTSRSAIDAFERPSAISPSTSRSRSLSDRQRVRLAASLDQPGDDGRVHDTLALADPVDRIAQDGDVRDPLLEQVADARGVLSRRRVAKRGST